MEYVDKSKRSAAGINPGNAVANSARVLRQPTNSATADGKSAACSCPTSQPKSWRGAGQRPAIPTGREAHGAMPLSDAELDQLISFFQTLDRWDREKARGIRLV